LFFLIQPGLAPELSLLTWISTFLVVLGLYPAFYGRRALQDWRSESVTTARITFVNRHIVVARYCLVLGVSGYVAQFEPWFGVANLAANAVWVAIWIPKRWRAKEFGVSAGVRADPETTFRFLIDPSNWTRYQSDLEAVIAHPEGPLGLGSEFTTRRRFATASSGSPPTPTSLEAHFKVIAMTSKSFTAGLLGRGDRSTTDVQKSGFATRVTGRGYWLLPVTDALLGHALEMQTSLKARTATSLQNYRRLDEILAGDGSS